MNPHVSCFMTVRNAATTLPDTLASLAAQRGISWELVVVDDGSSDATLELLQRFAATCPPKAVRIIATAGIGRGPALNLAWTSCRGRLLANLDADDLFHPDKLAIQGEVMSNRPDIGLLATQSIYIRAGQSPGWTESATTPRPVHDIAPLLGRYNPVNHSSVMMRRTVLDDVGGYNEALRRQLDYELWIRAAQSGHRVHQLDLPLSAKRLHSGQSFEARLSLQYILSSFALQNRAIRALRLPMRYYFLSALRVLYRLLPQFIRRPLADRKRHLLSSAPDS